MNTPGEPDELETLMSGSVGGTRKPTVVIRQGGGCLPYDISVIYLFLDGVLVGEAYCAELMGRRVSVWEAQTENRADTDQAKQAASESLASRQRIQQEATGSRKKRAQEARRLEQQRQMDRQRDEIHPPHVLSKLATMQPLPPEKLRLPKAEPDPEWERPVQRLAIRERGEEVR